MRTFLIFALASLSVLPALIGCSSSTTTPGENVRVSAATSANKVTPGMTVKQVEELMKGQGTPDGADPNLVHYPTEDGDVRVTFANGQVASVSSNNER